LSLFLFFFFFQAEDGIRDFHVTGVQTCALPISLPAVYVPHFIPLESGEQDGRRAALLQLPGERVQRRHRGRAARCEEVELVPVRSEERRVGKEWRSRGSPEQ